MKFSYLMLFLFNIFLSLSSSSTSQSQSQFFTSFSISNSPWKPSQNRTLISPNSTFAAGFHSSPISPNLFIFSVWYFNLSSSSSSSSNQFIIWSANYHSPVSQTASLIINSQSGLLLINGSSISNPNLWPSPAPFNSSSPNLVIDDNGNLGFGLWNSFDHPTDTLLPNQEIKNDTVLTSRNGKFKFSGSTTLIFNGSDPYWSSSNGFLRLESNGVLLQTSVSLYLSDFNQTRTRRLTLNDDGNLRVWSFEPGKRKWVVTWQAIQEICTVHGLCGSGSICYSDGSTVSGYECVCPPGYKWDPNYPSCKRKIPLIDFGKSKFLRLDYVNYSGGSNPTNLVIYNLIECESKCLSNPRCLGFGFKYDGSGYCVLQLDNLQNGFWSPGTTRSVFYLRVDKSEPNPTNFTGMLEVVETTCPTRMSLPDPPKESNDTTRNVIIVSGLFAIEIASGVLMFWAFLRRYYKYRDMAQTFGLGFLPTAGPKRFSYAELKRATNDFSNENLIGRGGFSDVYMGKFPDGRSVAVKCLKITGGDTEFWAEVTSIARMHHLNLVRLWGFCNEKGKRILVYEYVPNGSLDKYLFRSGFVGSDDPVSEGGGTETDPIMGPRQKPILDWSIRYRIALGVARAIAYLHEECLEWVLHCDIKPENILLGDDFCPKVADFGLSKLRKKEQLVTMSRIRGTRGYLAPEWAKNDPITSKVDVYSFGMVLLEIVSGIRNANNPMQGSSSTFESHEWYFPRWFFEMGIEERRLDEILDRQIRQSYDNKVHIEMIDRMVKTAMWCLQERPEMRPSMGKVAKMLEGAVEIMEPPKPTIFFIGADK